MLHIGLFLGIPKLGGYIFTLAASCLRTEAFAAGVQVTSASGRSVEEQAFELERMAGLGVDVLIVKPLVVDHLATTRSLDRIQALGIPVVTLDSVIEHPAVVCTISSDNHTAQGVVARHVFDRMNGRGRVAFLAADPRSAAGALRNASFHEQLKSHPGIELAHEATIDWIIPVSRRSQAARHLREALAQGLVLDGVIATNDEAALGAIDVLEQTGRPLPIISGFDGLPDALLAIHQGRLAATQRQMTQAMARSMLDAAQALARGEAVPRHLLLETQFVTAERANEIALDALRFVSPLIQDLTQHHEQQRELQQEVIAKQARILQAVVAVSNAVRHIRDPRLMMQALVDLVAGQFGLHRAAIYTASAGEDGSERWTFETTNASSIPAANLGMPVAEAAYALFSKALHSPEPQRMANPVNGAAVGGLDAESVIRSRLVLALTTAERRIGVLDLQSSKATTFGSELVMVLEAIASQIASAIDNANLYGETVRLAESELRESRAKAEFAERAKYLSDHDVLTGLPNRRLFNERLEQAIGEARRYDRRLAVLFIDIDRFKQINDTLGHEAGDQLLKEVSLRLKACLRDTDTVARQGGDEFVVLLPDLPGDQSPSRVARKIIQSIARPISLLGQDIRVTASLGIAVHPEDGVEELELTKHADIAMYHAKKEGKNNFQFYSERLNTHSLERLALEAGLRHALEHKEFRLHYQAKRDTQTGQIMGAEVFLRWQHPELGTLAPLQFLAVAEETGLIVHIGRWVMTTACHQNVAWQQQGLPRFTMSVNLTHRQFVDANLLSDIRTILAETGMEPDLLELEVNESTLLRDNEKTLAILTQLKQLGVRIAIDDFGTGYSLLSTLKDYPLDTVKIDRSFIRGIDGGSEDQSLTKAIISMGRSLRLNIVAQGVETRAQADFLRENACDEFQGFYFNSPVPAEQFIQACNAPAPVRQATAVAAATSVQPVPLPPR